MDVHNTSIHVVIGKYTVRHIRHVFDLTESVQCDLSVDAFVAFRCAVLMPGRLDETGGNGIDCDAFWLKFLYQRFGKPWSRRIPERRSMPAALHRNP